MTPDADPLQRAASLGLRGPVGAETVDVAATPGMWTAVEVDDAAAVVAAVAGLLPADLSVVLDGEEIGSRSPVERHRAQLCVAGCRLDPLPALRVGDVIGLGLRAPQPPWWQALVGTSRARASSADDEARVRAIAGRIGLSRWVDRTAVNLPLKVEALVDLGRALAGLPKALVWRRPEWLDPASLAEINDAVAAEQGLAGFTVVEFARRAAHAAHGGRGVPSR